jgi:hypothetical protein
MSELISHVSKQVKAIIWIPGSELKTTDATYKSVDYLLDGLLTAKFNQLENLGNQVLLGKSFGENLFVFISETGAEKELQNFKTLLKPELTAETEVLVLNESDKKFNLDLWTKELPSKTRVL